MQNTVLMIVRPPGLPVTNVTWPFFETTTGVIELSIRFPATIWLGFVPIRPFEFVMPGRGLKSPISLFNTNPAPRTTIREPQLSSNVYVLATAIPSRSMTLK